MKMIESYGFYPKPHWACKECLVRPMCQDDECPMTRYLHKLCTTCKCKHRCPMKNDCEKIKEWKVWRMIERTWGPEIVKHFIDRIKETSPFYRLMTMPKEKTEIKWWFPNAK